MEVLLQYIPHNNGPDTLSPKLTYWKRTAKGFRTGFPAEFTLSQDEAIRLRDVLDQGLKLTGAGADGAFLLVPIGSDDEFDSSGHNPVEVAQALISVLHGGGVLAAAASDSAGAAAVSDLQSSIQLAQLNDAIAELEWMLNGNVVDEASYQSWCDRHSWAFGSAYVMRDDVRSIALGDQVDLLMKQTSNGLRDVFELKRPDKDSIGFDGTHKSWFWSRETSMAVGQCHRYLDALHEAASTGLRDHPEVVAYHPRASIVIGRSHDWDDVQQRALHGLNARLHGIQVMTYDHLLHQARAILSTLGMNRERDPLDD